MSCLDISADENLNRKFDCVKLFLCTKNNAFTAFKQVNFYVVISFEYLVYLDVASIFEEKFEKNNSSVSFNLEVQCGQIRHCEFNIFLIRPIQFRERDFRGHTTVHVKNE